MKGEEKKKEEARSRNSKRDDENRHSLPPFLAAICELKWRYIASIPRSEKFVHRVASVGMEVRIAFDFDGPSVVVIQWRFVAILSHGKNSNPRSGFFDRAREL